MKTKPLISFSGGVGCSEIFPFIFDFGFVMVRYSSENGRQRMDEKGDEIRKGGEEITQSNSHRSLWILGVLLGLINEEKTVKFGKVDLNFKK